MAFTCCLKCDASYLEREERCPKCGTHNFFCDADTEVQAVNVLIARLRAQRREDKAEKLRQLNRLYPPSLCTRFWQQIKEIFT